MAASGQPFERFGRVSEREFLHLEAQAAIGQARQQFGRQTRSPAAKRSLATTTPGM